MLKTTSRLIHAHNFWQDIKVKTQMYPLHSWYYAAEVKLLMLCSSGKGLKPTVLQIHLER